MSRGFLCGALLLLLGRGPLFPLPAQKLLYPGEWPYDALAALAQEQRIAFFSGAMVTVSQMQGMLEEIDGESLSPEGGALYEKLRAYLEGPADLSLRSGALELDVWAALQGELYYNSNEKTNWIYDHTKRKPFFSFPVSLSFSPFATLELDTNVEQRRDALNHTTNYGNFFFWDSFNFNMPHRAYLSLGLPIKKTSGLQFKIGMGEDFFGRTHTGSIILSDQMTDVTYAGLSFYSPLVKYSANIMQLKVDKYFYYHTLEARILRRLNFSMFEGLLVNAPLELRYLNPTMIFHSFHAYGDYGAPDDDPVIDKDNARVASFFAMKLELLVFKYTRIYGIWALNELQTADEKRKNPRALRPDSFAFQGGSEFSIPVSWAGGGHLKFGVEGVYTFPFMYVMQGKDWSYYKPADSQTGDLEFWTGTPFGPDSAAASLWAGFHRPQWSLSTSLLFLAQGERSSTAIFETNTYHPWRTKNFEETRLVSPSGRPSYTWALGFSGTWSIKEWLTLRLDPGYKIVNNYGHAEGTEQGIELAFSVRLTPPRRFNFKF
ncbi:MAG: hypothetical protein LBQ46_13540 [Treponema sp.]|nr:hypothetical protein [Treponema sp.]